MIAIVGILCHQYDVNLSARCFTVVNDETRIIVATVVVVAAAVSCCAVTKMMRFYTTAPMKKKQGKRATTNTQKRAETHRNAQKHTETQIVVSAPCATYNSKPANDAAPIPPPSAPPPKTIPFPAVFSYHFLMFNLFPSDCDDSADMLPPNNCAIDFFWSFKLL